MLVTDLKKKVKPVCPSCGSADIRLEAWVGFNITRQNWEIEDLTENMVCNNCGKACQPKWVVIGEPK